MIYKSVEYVRKMEIESRQAYNIPFVSDVPSYLFRNGKRKQLVCVDLGSHIGTFSKHYSKHFFRIFCYEPSRDFFLESTKALGHLPNVKVFNFGISRVNGELLTLREVVVDGISEGKDVTSSRWDEDGLRAFHGKLGGVVGTSQSKDWASISSEIGSRIFLLKCDVEGGEYEAFIDADLSNVDFIAMELHYTALGPARTNELLEKLLTQFDFIDPKQAQRFAAWPPPSMVFLVNRTCQDRWLGATRAALGFRNSLGAFISRLKGILSRRT